MRRLTATVLVVLCILILLHVLVTAVLCDGSGIAGMSSTVMGYGFATLWTSFSGFHKYPFSHNLQHYIIKQMGGRANQPTPLPNL